MVISCNGSSRGKLAMRLSRKLWFFIILTLVIPMLIIALYAAWLVSVNTEQTQWRYLENIYNQIENDIRNTEKRYLKEANDIAKIDFIVTKLYVYSKYWEKLSESIREFDIVPLEDFLKQSSLSRNLENLAVYRKSFDDYHKLISFGRSLFIPETIFKSIHNQKFGIPVYIRYSDGIYLQVMQKVYSESKAIGVIFLLKGYTASYFSGISAQFNVKTALISKNVIFYNSVPETDEQLLLSLSKTEESQQKLTIGSTRYLAYFKDFSLGNGASGTLVLYLNADEVQNAGGAMVRKILLISIGCLLIPVLTFLIWGSKLVAGIKSLANATTRISEGDFDHQIDMKRDDEFGILCQNFNDMVVALKKNRSILESRNIELQIKNSYIDAVFQSLLINIIVLDDDFNIRVVSSSAESKLALPRNPVGKKLFKITPFQKKASFFEKEIEESWRTGDFRRLSSVLLGSVSYEIDLYPVKENGNKVQAIVMVLINISERIKMERALLRSERLASVGQLAAGIAHEINNPLSVIMNHVQLIQSGKLNEDEENKFMTRISSEIKRVNGLIDRLLQFSREEKHQTELTYPLQILQDILNLFAPKKQENNYVGNPCVLTKNAFNAGRWTVNYKGRIINVCLTDSGNQIPIHCSADSLKQVFFNIFKNALQAINHDFGKIQIHINADKNMTEIKITDNGSGIEEGNLDRIFDPFFSVKRESGTGLGLSLSQTIIERIGGNISAESNSDQGTVFTISIPGEEKLVE